MGEWLLGLKIVKAIIDILKSLRDLMTGHKAEAATPLEPDNPLQVAKRFVELFDVHGVKRSQIPRFFGHGLTLDMLKTDESLLANLSDEMLDAAAELFAVRREWLDGAEQRVYPRHDFYKHPEAFEAFAAAISQRCTEFDIYCWVLRKPQPAGGEFDTLLVIQEGIGYVGDRAIYRLHLCNNWIFQYWKSRAYLTACIAIAWRQGWYVWGRDVEADWLDKVVDGNFLIGFDLGDACFPTGRHWETDNQVLRPDEFLQFVDEGLFGKVSALDLWLRLSQQGYMDLGDHPVVNYQSLFADKFKALKVEEERRAG